MATPEIAMKRARDFPFAGMAVTDTATLVVASIMADLSDRKGLRHVLEDIDDEILAEIADDLTAIARAALAAWDGEDD